MAFGRQNSLSMAYSKPVERISLGAGIDHYLNRVQEAKVNDQKDRQINQKDEQININRNQQKTTASHFKALEQQSKDTAIATLDKEERLRNQSISASQQYLTDVGVNVSDVLEQSGSSTPSAVKGTLDGAVATHKQKELRRLAGIKSRAKTKVINPLGGSVLKDHITNKAISLSNQNQIPVNDLLSNKEWVQSQANLAEEQNQSGNFSPSKQESSSIPIRGKSFKFGDTVELNNVPYTLGRGDTSGEPRLYLNKAEANPKSISSFTDMVNNDIDFEQTAEVIENFDNNILFKNFGGEKGFNFMMDITDGNYQEVKRYYTDMARSKSAKSGGVSSALYRIPGIKGLSNALGFGTKISGSDADNLISFLSNQYSKGNVLINKNDGLRPTNTGIPSFDTTIIDENGKPIPKDQTKRYISNWSKNRASEIRARNEKKIADGRGIPIHTAYKKYRETIKAKGNTPMGFVEYRRKFYK